MEYTGMKNVLKEFLNRIIKDDSTTTKNTWSASKINSELKTKMNSSVTHLSGDVPTSRKINNKELSSDITLSASDIGAVPTSRTVNNKALSSNISLSASDVGAITKSDLLDFVYPVGSIYMSVNNVSPQTFLGGTWNQIKDTFLLSAGDTYKAGTTGGESEVVLTKENLPSHNHTIDHTHSTAKTANTAIMAYGGSSYSYNGIGNKHFTASYRDVSVPKYSGNSGSTGSGVAHNNMPPYLVVYMWKRTA